jgi:hypothetical protein
MGSAGNVTDAQLLVNTVFMLVHVLYIVQLSEVTASPSACQHFRNKEADICNTLVLN